LLAWVRHWVPFPALQKKPEKPKKAEKSLPKPGVAAHAFTCLEEEEARGSRAQGQPQLHSDILPLNK
jgi:hypothetical protein